MKISIKKRLLGLVAAGVIGFSGAAFAQGDKAASLDQLLQMMKDSKAKSIESVKLSSVAAKRIKTTSISKLWRPKRLKRLVLSV